MSYHAVWMLAKTLLMKRIVNPFNNSYAYVLCTKMLEHLNTENTQITQ